MELPKPLKPWASVLNLFPAELAGALGPLVLRLDRLVGPPRRADETAIGEPDGFDGLTLRGPYERLLLTDWLLLSEVPEEFVRRAVMNEHSFYRLQRRLPSGGRMSVALFDAGPESFGTPRIGQLAALVVLYRRAVASGMRFLWGNLQNPQVSFEEVTPESVKAWLSGHSSQVVTDTNFAVWRQQIAQEAGTHLSQEDFWLVGGPMALTLDGAKSVSRLFLTELYDLERRAIQVRIQKPGQGVGTGLSDTTLSLPEDAVCVRLLRDPFEAARQPIKQTNTKFAPYSNLVFDVSGVKLYARSADGQIVAYPIPNSPNAPYGSPRLYRSAYLNPVLSVGRSQRSTLLLTCSRQSNNLRLEAFGGRSAPSIDLGYSTFNEASLNPPATLEVIRHADFMNAFVARLPNSEVEQISLSQKSTLTISHNCVAWALGPRVLLCVERADNKFVMQFIAPEKPGEVTVERHGGPGGAFFGSTLAWPSYLCLETAPRHWTIYAIDWPTRSLRPISSEPITVPSNTRVIGYGSVRPATGSSIFALLVLEEDGRTISGYYRNGQVTVLQASSRIIHATVSQEGQQMIAYSTESGEVVVHSLWHRTALYRLQPESPPSSENQPSLPVVEFPETDSLTELPTVHVFWPHLETLFGGTSPARSPLVVILLDIDRFTQFNQEYGQEVGDALLRSFADTLKEYAKDKNGFVARIGSDEFGLIFPDMSPPDLAADLQELQDKLRQIVVTTSSNANDPLWGSATAPGISIGAMEFYPSADYELTGESVARGVKSRTIAQLEEARSKKDNKICVERYLDW